MGDAAGVGPELCLNLLARRDLPSNVVPLIIGDADVLKRVARELKLTLDAPQLDAPPESLNAPAVYDPPGSLAGNAVVPGRNQAICGKAAGRYIEEAVKGCLAGRFHAMLTAPISKKAMSLAGYAFPGHTEMLAHLTHCDNYAMLLYSSTIACAFVTTHQSLRSVPDALTQRRIVEVGELASDCVTAIRGAAPRLAVLGLNPHAGEEGLFGDEENRIITPAKAQLESQGLEVEGPLPPDTAFTPAALKRIGCHIAMYHDQGSIPFKMLAFNSGVNVTMGLPIVRTSPDHGTAFDIAWKGRVDPDSFVAAFALAAQLGRHEIRVHPSGLHRLDRDETVPQHTSGRRAAARSTLPAVEKQ